MVRLEESMGWSAAERCWRGFHEPRERGLHSLLCALFELIVLQDAQVLEDVIKQTQDMLPSLRAEYAQAALELRQEETDVAELQNSDKDYLNELKASIAEQEYV